MKQIIKKGLHIIRTRGLNDLFNAVYFRSKSVINKSVLSKKFIKKNDKEWQQVKNKYKGKRVFLIGNGPSLNKTELYLLKDEYTFCFNHFNLFFDRLHWTPSFYSITDNLVLEDKLKDLKDLVQNTEISFFPHIHFKGNNFRRKIGENEKILWTNQIFGTGVSDDLPRIFQGGTVIYEAFQILMHLGFSEIYFIGVDMNYKIHKNVEYFNKGNKSDILSKEDDDPNHFDPRYFGKGKKYHQPEDYILQNIMNNLRLFAEYSKEKGQKVFNAGYDSKVDFFPFKPLRLIFSKQQRIAKFDQLVKEKTSFRNYKELEKKIERIELDNFDLSGLQKISFITNDEDGLKVVKKLITSHIILGPFEDQLIFIKRNWIK